MRLIDLVHRWTGGIIGLLLALIGLSGTMLLHKDWWVSWSLPAAADSLRADPARLAELVAAWRADPGLAPRSITFADDGFGLHRLYLDGDAGAYADQAGDIVARWNGIWDRPELWLFDFHHHLLAGEAGETITGILGLIGLGFVITGTILWWSRRKSFKLRLLPARMTRPAILRHHRDLGIVLAPLLFLSMLTGTAMVLRPIADYLLAPLSPPGSIERALAAPDTQGGPLAVDPDWRAMFETAERRFPGAHLRVLSIPEEGLIRLRTRQPEEWLPQGRSTLWFDAPTGDLVEDRDALAMPGAAQAFNLAYPLHAAKVGGLGYRLVMTLSGLGLTLLGSLSVWSFWFRRKPRPISRSAKPRPSAR